MSRFEDQVAIATVGTRGIGTVVGERSAAKGQRIITTSRIPISYSIVVPYRVR